MDKNRILSLDALRGFDMLWIVGGAKAVSLLDRAVDNSFTNSLNTQMEHAEWIGFNFMDLIMPLFLFLTGCSLAISLKRRRASSGDRSAYKHVVKRFLILWFLGLIFQGKLLYFEWDKIEFFSNTLQAIAAGYLGASLIILLKRKSWQILTTLLLLIGYWAALNLTPGFDLSPDGNLAIYIDKLLLGNHIGAPEYTWILTSITFTVTVMLGVFAGGILTCNKNSKIDIFKKILIYGVGLTLLGWALAFGEPCIKKIWTSSFTLISAGISAILLSLFYGVIDVANYTTWAKPLTYLGRNAILAYMIFAYNKFLNLSSITDKFLFGTKQFLDNWYPFINQLAALTLLFAIFYYLDKRGYHFKV